ncbi:helix-turn-helix transcriptional regulator [Microtetraspora malaysiensis]|uniref:helix-turn-helix transcriptional regulator n=1 Tax=Microtetraspora malaysiensis TaxID=161358 RepID=UPI003D9222AD
MFETITMESTVKARQEYRIDFAKLRKHSGLTQEQVARALGVRQNTVSSWELGAQPSARFLPPMAELFGLTIEELFGLPRP